MQIIKLAGRLCFSTALLLLCLATQANEALTFGHKEIYRSKVLGEERELLVHLPRDYENQPEQHYPVLYTLDGNSHFKHVVGTVEWLSASSGMIPDHIVVAIVNTDRFRDFSPSIPQNYHGEGNPGGADQFIKFISTELIPHIDQKYRTQPFRILAGHSFGGLLTLHAMMTAAKSFNAYISQSPFIIYDEAELVNRLTKTLNKNSSLNAFLFMTLGNETNLRQEYDRLALTLNNQAPKSLTWFSHIYPLETHMSTPSKTLHNALIAMRDYAGWSINDEVAAKGIAAIRKHYNALSKQFGFTIAPPEREINRLGYVALVAGHHDKAITIFQQNIQLFPQSINAYDSLAEAYQTKGNIEKAITLQLKAVNLAKQTEPRSLNRVEARLDELLALKHSR